MLSQETQKVIADVMNEPIVQPPKPHFKYEDLYRSEVSQKLKYSELLSVTRELVLPVHFKVLLEL
jgi:hypothetical protein